MENIGEGRQRGERLNKINKKDKKEKYYECPTVDVAAKFSCPKDLEIFSEDRMQGILRGGWRAVL